MGDQEYAHDTEQSEFSVAFYQRRKKGKYREVEAPHGVIGVADTHAHLDLLDHPAWNLARCAYYGVDFICSMCDPAEDGTTTYEQLEFWRSDAAQVLREAGLEAYAPKVPSLRIAIGCHPHNAKDYTPEMEAFLLERLRDPRTCAVGEVGLDYHYDISPREQQRQVFRRQIRLAHMTGLPLILHMREAHDEGFALLQEEGFPAAGVVLHCCNLDPDTLAPWVEAGCYIAYGGPLTFKHADDVRAGARMVPLNHLLTETDSPYMTPEPMRGMVCGPEHTIFTAQRMLEVRECTTAESQQELLSQMYHNAITVLDRDPTPWQRDIRGVSAGADVDTDIDAAADADVDSKRTAEAQGMAAAYEDANSAADMPASSNSNTGDGSYEYCYGCWR